MAFKELIEIGGVCKAKGISDFSDIPIRVAQEGHCLGGNPLADVIGRSPACDFPYGSIQGIDMDMKLLRNFLSFS